MDKNNAITNHFLTKKYSLEDKTSWNNFVKSAKNATFLFQRDFMDYHSDRFEDYSLLVYKDEKLVAVLPANISGSELHSHQGLSYGGLVLKLKLLPKIYHIMPSDEIDYLLFLLKAKLIRRDITSCVLNENVLKINSSNRLRGIKKGEKNELQVREGGKFKAFWNEVLEPNLKQIHNQKPVHSLEEITLLQSRFPKNIKQFNVFKNDQIVAGTTIFETATVAHAQYISANEMGRQTGGLDFLFNNLLQHYSNKKYFDFGISNEAQGMKVNQGLLNWKESFGGRTIAHDFYEIETGNHQLLNDIFL